MCYGDQIPPVIPTLFLRKVQAPIADLELGWKERSGRDEWSGEKGESWGNKGKGEQISVHKRSCVLRLRKIMESLRLEKPLSSSSTTLD